MAEGNGVELAKAYVTLIPTLTGAQGAITESLIPAAEKAGDQAGERAGSRFGGGVGKGLAAAGIVTAAAGIGKGLYEIGATFDDVADTIRVQTGATGDTLDGLVDVAKDVGREVPASFDQIGPVVAGLNQRLGLSGDQLETVAAQYLQAGNILGQTVDIDKTSAAFTQFGISGADVSAAMDQLFQVSQATGVGMNDLASAAQSNGAAMQNLGFSFGETISLTGALDKAGLNSTAVLSSMGKGLVTLAKDGEEPQAAFRRVTDEIGALIASGDTAGAIDLASGIFGTKAANQFVGAVQSGTLALDDLTAGVGATSDTILGVGDQTADFAEKWQVVKNNAQLALEPLASGVFNGLADALTGVMPYLQQFGTWLGENQWVLGTVAAVIGGTLVAAFVAWTASVWASTVALLANPITWIILGIVALVAALVLLIANWDSVVAWLQSVWASIVGWLSGVWDSITSGISSFASSVAGWFTSLWENAKAIVTGGVNAVVSFFTSLPGRAMGAISSLLSSVGGFFSNLWANAKAIVSGGVSAVVSFFTSLPGRAMGAVASLLASLGSFFTNVWNSAKSAVSSGVDGVIGFVTGLPGRILSALGNLGSLLVNAGKNILSGLLDGLKAGFNKVKDFVGGIGSWIADHKGPKAYDLALLVDNGGWIMTGLQRGIENSIPDLRRSLARVTSEIQAGMNTTATTTAAINSALRDGSAGAGPGGRAPVNMTTNLYTNDPALAAREVAELQRSYLGVTA